MTAQGMTEGTIIQNRYRLIRMLGVGGMGEVWEARHSQLHKERYAIKFLYAYGQETEQFERFSREAKILHHLDHTNITKILDVQLQHTPPFIALEYLEGEPLSRRIERTKAQGSGGLPFDEVESIISQVRDALEVTHHQGVIHRDLKPENIYLCQQERSITPLVKVLDFGVSKMTGEQQITQHQQGFLGTPQYMSPEQALGNENLDPRADQFSLAIILYEMLSGELPFKGEQIVQIATQIVHGDPAYIRELVPMLPEVAAQAIHRALCKSPDDRFSSCSAFVNLFIEGLQHRQEVDEWALDSQTEVGIRHSLISGLSPIGDQPLHGLIDSAPDVQVDEGSQTIQMLYTPDMYSSTTHQVEAENSSMMIERPLSPPHVEFNSLQRSHPSEFPGSNHEHFTEGYSHKAYHKKKRAREVWLIPLIILATLGGVLSTVGGELTLKERAQQVNQSPSIKGSLILPKMKGKISEISLISNLKASHKKQIKLSRHLPPHQRVLSPSKVSFLVLSPKDSETRRFIKDLTVHWMGERDSFTHTLSLLPTRVKQRSLWSSQHNFKKIQSGRWVVFITAQDELVAELPFEVK